ncbi:hypothetical protein [Frankia sp. Cas4]|nr:hypothetical protein [Frankia sp. Cas4]
MVGDVDDQVILSADHGPPTMARQPASTRIDRASIPLAGAQACWNGPS